MSFYDSFTTLLQRGFACQAAMAVPKTQGIGWTVHNNTQDDFLQTNQVMELHLRYHLAITNSVLLKRLLYRCC